MEINTEQPEYSGRAAGYRKKKALKVASLLALFILFSVGAVWFLKEYYGSDFFSGGKKSEAALEKFQSYGELLAFMEENENRSANKAGYSAISTNDFLPESSSSSGRASQGWGSAEAPSNVPTDGWGYSTPDSSSDYSKTNVQVEGVDESDIWKTDGEYIYAASGRRILIIDALPTEEAKIVSTISLDYAPSGIYISGDRLAVFGGGYSIKPLGDFSKVDGNRNSNYADFSIYDLSDRRNPKKEKQYDFEGSYINSRMIGDYVYFVTATTPVFAYYDEKQPVPYLLEDGNIVAPPNSPGVYYFNTDYVSQNFTTISAINLKNANESIKNESYILDGSQNSMYVSESNIYITFSKYTSEQELMVEVLKDIVIPRLSEKNKERVSEIENAKPHILSAGEKSAKISLIFERYYSSLGDEERKSLKEESEAKIKERYESISREKQKTLVHKISINKGRLKYESKGDVPGRVLNQFAMDENADGYFRIATTVDTSWSRIEGESTKSFNNLYVLDKNMKRVGQVEDIAKDEKIYSVRFMQNRAYMVTFKRTDPLFVIGLDDPRNPSVLGELKVPGYSTYLHPYDENKIIGLGKNATDSGVEIDGIKLSLFDATDVGNPKEVDTYILGDYGSNSLALGDAKAFLFSKEKNLLAIPAIIRKQEGSSKYSGITVAAGLAVFKVDDSGFDYKGVIDHRTEKEKANSSYSSYFGDSTGAKRGLYIGDNLYSISSNYLKINRIEDLESVKSISVTDIYNNTWSWEK